MEELLAILEEIVPDIDYKTCDTLIDDGVLTSFDLVMLAAEISQEFGVTIPAHRITPEVFNSAETIYGLIVELGGES